ncbi:MAG TPA: ABC transporter substrate-binding protein, partial [Spirochaetia bacterium]|nr:ABC transporter substrate-binding protein [Spirochaetia bacterium]
MKRALSILVLLVLSVALFAGGQKEAQKPGTTTATTKEIKNPDTFIYVSHGDAETLDPCKAYDNASGGVIQNIYETLVYYDGPSTDKFVPILAEQVPTVENGGITNGGKTYRFKIRKGVTFHSGNPLTPEDVRYSFLRALVTDPDAGPIWMFYSPFFGTSGSRDDDGNIVAKFEDFEKAVKVEGDYVVFNLRAPFPPFLATLCGSWSSIVDKKFCIEHGDWDGTAATWKKYNAPKDGAEILNHIAS